MSNAAAAPMPAFDVTVEAISFWSDHLPDWTLAAAALRGEQAPLAAASTRPSPSLLPPAERRRAPDSVALGLEVARAAVAASGRDPRDLPSVFASAHGDLGIADYICATLAQDPSLLSPVKFHNSVHNAVSGYWGIATGSHAASTSVAAFERTFALGLLEALSQLRATGSAVLLVGFDVAAVGPLAQLARSDGRLAVALVLAPRSAGGRAGAGHRWRLQATVVAGDGATPIASAAGQALAGNALADSLVLFEALARSAGTLSATAAVDRADADAGADAAGQQVLLPLGPATTLQIELHLE